MSDAGRAEYGVEHVRDLARSNAGEWRQMRRDLVVIRGVNGLTQQDVAERLGIRRSDVRRFENYDADAPESMWMRYASAVGIAFELKARAWETEDD